MLRTECTVGKRVIADSGPATIVGEGRQDNEIFVYLDDEHLIGTFHCEDLEPLVIKDSDPVIFEGLWDPFKDFAWETLPRLVGLFVRYAFLPMPYTPSSSNGSLARTSEPPTRSSEPLCMT